MLFTVTSLALSLFFALLAITLSIKEERTRKILRKQTQEQKQKILQISILKEIQDRIGYSLDIEEVVDVLTGSLKHLFPYSSASSMVLKDGKIVFKTSIEESISHKFIDSVKQNMLASLNALLPSIPSKIEEQVSGAPFDDTNTLPPYSFFQIPLVVSNKVVGLLNISSTKPNLYKEDEMTIFYQITEQASNALTRLEVVLTTEKGKLTSMIASLADGVFMLDNEKNVLIINDSAKRFLRLNGTPSFFEILNTFPKEYYLSNKIEKVVLTKLPTQEEDIKLGENSFQTFITPVISSEGKVIGVSFLLHDITLEKSIAQVREDFTNMVVHELRAPLTAVKDSAELMLDKKVPLADKKQLLEIINSRTKLLLDQVSDILDASKIEAGRFMITPAPNDLGKVISEVVKTFSPQAEKKQVALSTRISPLPSVVFDKIRMTQVLNNLVSNSLKFTPIGGKIKITAAIDGNFVKVSVSDTGVGIPLDKQKEVFSKFYQVATPQHKPGTGLGLYIVKGVVEAHKGKVELFSEEGKETTIFFTLPIMNQPQIPNYRTLN